MPLLLLPMLWPLLLVLVLLLLLVLLAILPMLPMLLPPILTVLLIEVQGLRAGLEGRLGSLRLLDALGILPRHLSSLARVAALKMSSWRA